MSRLVEVQPQLVRGEALPDLPSAFLRVAVADMKKVSRRKNYVINMGHYHSPSPVSPSTTECNVCLAGAVMAGTLQAPFGMEINPDRYIGSIEMKLRALDQLRAGRICAFFRYMQKELPAAAREELRNLTLDFYSGLSSSRVKALCKEMTKAAKIMEKYGL